jgi:hypothetical protein
VPAPPLLVHDYEASGSGDRDRREIGAIAALQIDPPPADRRHWIATGAYELELAVCARDVDARFYSTMIEFDGRWHDGPGVWEKLRIHPFGDGRAPR